MKAELRPPLAAFRAGLSWGVIGAQLGTAPPALRTTPRSLTRVQWGGGAELSLCEQDTHRALPGRLRGRQPGRPVRHRHQRLPTCGGLRIPGHSTTTPPTSRCPESSIRPQTHRPASRSGHTSISGRRTDDEAVRRSWRQPDHPAPGAHRDRHPASPTRQTIRSQTCSSCGSHCRRRRQLRCRTLRGAWLKRLTECRMIVVCQCSTFEPTNAPNEPSLN